MKQVLQSIRSGEVQVTDVPAPVVPDNGVLVRTIASLVSAGTERMVVEFAEKNLLQKARARPDLVRQVLQRARREGLSATFDTVRRNLDQPMPLGYSLVGEVIDVGAQTRGARVGDLVACAGMGVASHAEFAAAPELLFARIPANTEVPADHFAFGTLGAIALHGFRLAQPQLGDRVAVIGLGLLGQLTIQIARAAGCQVFGVDLSAERVDLARRFGVAAALRADAEAAGSAFSDGMMFDSVLVTADTTSSDPGELAAALARDRAHVIAVGAFDLRLPRKPYFQKELTFQVSRSYGPGRYDPQYELHGHDYPAGFVRWTLQRNLASFVHLLATGAVQVAPLISHRFEVTDAPRAYEVITGKAAEKFIGVLLTYPRDAEARPRVELAAAVAADPVATPGVSVVGAGLFASATLLPALKQAGSRALRGIVSAHGVSARTMGAAHGFAFCTSRFEDVLSDADTHTVMILTRHHLHAPQVLAALQAGKHVFVEKPLCLTSAELSEIGEAAAAHPGQLLMVGFNRRFSPHAQRMKTFLETGEPLVLTYRCNAGYLPPEHWTHDPAQGGGRLVGEASHFIDFANYLCGGTPAKVSAVAMDDVGRYQGDNLAITLAYPNGSVATIVYTANGDKQSGKERIEAFSGGRTAVLDDFRLLELSIDGRVQRHKTTTDKGHAQECALWLDAIRTGGASPIPLADIIGSMRATFAAQESVASGMPVALD
jgi:predicted dehydrogenase/threonine dehydrogenase-like Zn-dependent dehydrogenase